LSRPARAAHALAHGVVLGERDHVALMALLNGDD
jgi:hypothetical protein